MFHIHVLIQGRALLAFSVFAVSLLCAISNHRVRADEITSKIAFYERLRNDIMNRPVALHKIPPSLLHHANHSYHLIFKVWLVDISDIDEINQLITVNLYIEVRWKQKELAWNVSDYGGIDYVWIDITNLWTPVILVVMGEKGSFVLEFSQTLEVKADGEVISARHNYLTFSCSIDFMKYPFDAQSCNIGFFPTGNNSTPTIEVASITDYPLSKYATTSGEWIFDSIRPDIVETAVGWSNFPRYNFTMNRQRVYYVITFIFPIILTSIMIPLAFLIPPETGERISYIVAVFTSTAIFINYISDVMPRSLSRMPYLAVFLIEVLVEGLLALLASLLVVNIYLSEERDFINADKLPRERLFTASRAYVASQDTKTMKSNSNVHSACPFFRLKWRVSSRQLDKVFFFIFVAGQGIFLFIMFELTDWL